MYIARQNTFKDLAETLKDQNIQEHFLKDSSSRELIRGMLMTACDISGPTKPWKIQKRIAALVTEEFFQQGDIERAVLNSSPIELMDREKRNEMPRLQVGFIESMCIPLYITLSQLWPELQCLVDRIKENAHYWTEAQTP
uniref:cGMP-specific 3',5'-cyclic phosphodiesterase (Trinotate prediction) n=1 Tax=Henneguya salminicola TaxID=69463 RepID=A0A6G3MLX7_HENSL